MTNDKTSFFSLITTVLQSFVLIDSTAQGSMKLEIYLIKLNAPDYGGNFSILPLTFKCYQFLQSCTLCSSFQNFNELCHNRECYQVQVLLNVSRFGI